MNLSPKAKHDDPVGAGRGLKFDCNVAFQARALHLKALSLQVPISAGKFHTRRAGNFALNAMQSVVPSG